MHKPNKLRPFILNLILIWLAILFYRTTNYYTNFLRHDTQLILLTLAITYTVFGFIYYSVCPRKETKGVIILSILKKITTKVYKYLTAPMVITDKITKKEKIICLFILVKIFFLPIMLNFFLSNLHVAKNQFLNFPSFTSLLTINSFNVILFPFLISLIFLIDTLWFSFGYTLEAEFLKNKIRSVEPTILGWVVALICYPPFNAMFTRYTNWYADIHIIFSNNLITFAMKISILTLLLIYVSATLSLGAKCSNLTNRGIVTTGVYSIIRHPAYISKNLAWWLVVIPIASWPAIISMSIWSFIYHLRTLTEERHLIQDPDYITYCQKVKYKYIPYVY